MYICVYVCINRFSDKEKQLFWNLKFHTVLSTIFSQLTLTLNCYCAMVSYWRHLISLLPKWKTHPSPVMTQHIRECSRNLYTPSARLGRGIYVYVCICIYIEICIQKRQKFLWNRYSFFENVLACFMGF